MNKQQTDPAALKAAYRDYVKKFVDEIEDAHKLCVVYSFIKGLMRKGGANEHSK